MKQMQRYILIRRNSWKWNSDW